MYRVLWGRKTENVWFSYACKEEREENFPLKGELSNSATASAVILGGRVPFTCLAWKRKFEKKISNWNANPGDGDF